MKRIKKNAEDLVTKHIAVTPWVYRELRKLAWLEGFKRLSDVIERLLKGDNSL